MINLITDLISFTQPTNLDKESLSVIESIAKIKTKINECINEFNNLENKTNEDYQNFLKQITNYKNEVIKIVNDIKNDNNSFKNEFREIIKSLESFNVTLEIINKQSEYIQELAKINQDNIDKGTIATNDEIKIINTSLEEKANKVYVTDTLTDVNDKINKNTTDIATQNARIDTFTNLSSGSTTGDAELIDGRNVNGTTYTNIGGAIRAVSSGKGIIDNTLGIKKLDNYLRVNLNKLNIYDFKWDNKGFDDTTHEPSTTENLRRLISDKILIKKGTIIEIPRPLSFDIMFYDESLNYEKESGFVNKYEFEKDSFMRLYLKFDDNSKISISDIESVLNIYNNTTKIINLYKDIYPLPIYNFTNLPINETTGEQESYGNLRRLSSDLIPVIIGSNFKNIGSNFEFKFYEYDSNKKLIGISEYVNEYTSKFKGYVRIMYKKKNDDFINKYEVEDIIKYKPITEILNEVIYDISKNKNISTNNLNVISKLDDEKMTHGSCSVYDKETGFVYCMYYYNPVSATENPTDLNIAIRLARFNLCKPQDVTYYHVAKNGDVIGDKTLTGSTAPYEPNLKIVGRTMYCFFNSGVNGSVMSMLLRRFNLDTLGFDNTLDILKIEDEGVSKDINITNVETIHNRLTGLSSKCTECRIISNFVGINNVYYCYLNAEGTNGLLLNTSNFINYRVVNVLPSNTLNDFMETDLEHLKGHLYFLFRHNNTGIYKIRYNLTTNTWSSTGLIKVADEPSKPKIFYNTKTGELNYIYNTNNRLNRVITSVSDTTQKETVIESQYSPTGVHYPSIFKNKNRIYETFTTSMRGFNNDRTEIVFHELDI